MKHSKHLRIFLGLIALFTCLPALADFVHPGVMHSSDSIAFAKSKIEAGEEPWASSWRKINDSRYSSLNWQPDPHANVERGPSNNPNIGSSDFSADANAAYYHSLCWAISGKTAHAEKAAEIIDAWSQTLESIGNHDARLLVGMSGFHFCIAAELIKHTWDGWPEKDQQRFASMLRDIWYPIIVDFYPSANGNWDASMLQCMIAMGVFLDDQAMFDRAKNYYLTGKGNGAIGNYFKKTGQCQETGRDQGHTQMGLEFLANTCETAWVQGIDLYSALDNRLLKGFEYTAKYNLGHDVPYEPYKSFEGRYHYKKISSDARGRLRSMYERVFNHYHNRKGLAAPFTEQAALKLRDQRRSRRPSHLDTLMFADQPANFPAKASVVCFGDSITKRGYFETLSELTGTKTVNAGVAGHSSSQGLRRMSADVLAKDPDVVVILFGTNDLRIDSERAFVPVATYKKNLKAMIARCQKQGAGVVLCTLPPIHLDTYFTRHERKPYEDGGGLATMIESYRDAAIEVASAEKIPLVDLNRLLATEPEWLSKDGVHPSQKGNRLIAKHIAQALAGLLAK